MVVIFFKLRLLRAPYNTENMEFLLFLIKGKTCRILVSAVSAVINPTFYSELLTGDLNIFVKLYFLLSAPDSR